MKLRLAHLVAVALLIPLLCPPGWAQEDERYSFDGLADEDPQPDDPTDWMTSVNWSDGGFDPDAAFGPLLPDFGTRVEIKTAEFGVNAPEIGAGDAAEAFGVRIGRFGGEGLLTMTGGTLDLADSCGAFPFSCNRRLRVGAADVGDDANRHPGTFNLSDGTVTTDTLWIGSGSQGEMNMTGGIVNTRSNFYLDWTFDAESVLNMMGGTINVGEVLRLFRTSSLNLDGGEILVAGAAELGTTTSLSSLQDPSVTVSITDGLLQSDDFLQIGGTVVVDGGILRAATFNETVSVGTVEINEGGTLQLMQESVADIEGLITSGFLTTSSPQGTDGFVIEIVDVNGNDFTQVAFPSGLRADFDMDGDVDGDDFLLWQVGFGANITSGATKMDGDWDNDGDVDGDDFLGWQAEFPSPGSGAGSNAIPEPATSLLLGLLTAITCLRGRRGGRTSSCAACKSPAQ